MTRRAGARGCTGLRRGERSASFKLLPSRDEMSTHQRDESECVCVCVLDDKGMHVCGYLVHQAALCECVRLFLCVWLSGCDTDPCGVAGLTALMSTTPSRARERNGTTKLTKK